MKTVVRPLRVSERERGLGGCVGRSLAVLASGLFSVRMTASSYRVCPLVRDNLGFDLARNEIS
ncbi:MAG: hypothetical protein J7J76_01960 [Candidatus Latescibacteria bacterium]|nr:hypothetical protein [Candidatus Latescibacterota bacterium]